MCALDSNATQTRPKLMKTKGEYKNHTQILETYLLSKIKMH